MTDASIISIPPRPLTVKAFGITDKGKVRVSVSLFGRPTAVELDYLQLRGH